MPSLQVIQITVGGDLSPKPVDSNSQIPSARASWIKEIAERDICVRSH